MNPTKPHRDAAWNGQLAPTRYTPAFTARPTPTAWFCYLPPAAKDDPNPICMSERTTAARFDNWHDEVTIGRAHRTASPRK